MKIQKTGKKYIAVCQGRNWDQDARSYHRAKFGVNRHSRSWDIN